MSDAKGFGPGGCVPQDEQGTGNKIAVAPERTIREGFVLGLDLDGVCADYTVAFKAHVAQTFGIDIDDMEDVHDWDFVKLNWGISSRAHFESLHAQAVEEGMFLNMPTLAGVSKALWTLSDAGIHIRVITHRLFIKGTHQRVASDTVGWLQKNNIPYRDICFIADKVKVGADAYLDDSPGNIEKLRGGGGNAIVFDQPYNRHVDGLRVHNWDEATRLILDLASE